MGSRRGASGTHQTPSGDALGGLGRGLEREAGLAGASRSRQRKQARVLGGEEREHLGELLLAPEEGCCRDGQVRAVERLERGERALSQLVDALGSRQILEPVLAEVCELELDELGRRGGDEHLPAVPCRGDPRGAMHVPADVALFGQKRCPGVQADPHLDRPRGQLAGKRLGGRQRTRCRREGEEERIPLRVDLDAALRATCLANDAPVLGESIGVRLRAELVQQLRRSLDVGEEEGDGAGREIGSHAA